MFQTFFFLHNFPFNLENDLFKKGALLLQAPAAQLKGFLFLFIAVHIMFSQVRLKDSSQKTYESILELGIQEWGITPQPFLL